MEIKTGVDWATGITCIRQKTHQQRHSAWNNIQSRSQAVCINWCGATMNVDGLHGNEARNNSEIMCVHVVQSAWHACAFSGVE